MMQFNSLIIPPPPQVCTLSPRVGTHPAYTRPCGHLLTPHVHSGQLRSIPHCQATAPDARVRDASLLQQPSPRSKEGFCSLPCVDSPSAFKAYWYKVAKPQVESLYRSCTACGPEVQLLVLLDQLLCRLKNMQAKGRHCEARHESRYVLHICSLLMGITACLYTIFLNFSQLQGMARSWSRNKLCLQQIRILSLQEHINIWEGL